MSFSFLKIVSTGIAILWIPLLANAAEEYEAGIDYKVLEQNEEVVATDTPSANSEKISVVEYFSYSCPACQKFEAHISNWLANEKDDVEFVREAVVFYPNWAPLAKAYYVAIELDVLDAVHMPMFEAMHDEKLPMDDPQHIEQLFVEEAKIESETFRTSYNDEDKTVINRVLEVHETVRAMRIKNTPTIVVDSRYLVNTRTAQSSKRIFPIVDYLVEKLREERKSANSNRELNE